MYIVTMLRLLCVVTVIALTYGQQCSSPPAGADRCECLVGDPTPWGVQVTMFDYAESQDYQYIDDEGRTRLVQYNPSPTEPCRYKLEAGVKETGGGSKFMAYAIFHFGVSQGGPDAFPFSLRFGERDTKLIDRTSGRSVENYDLDTEDYDYNQDGVDYHMTKSGRHILLTSVACNLDLDYKKLHPFDSLTICTLTSPASDTPNPADFLGKCGNCNNLLDDDDYFYEE